MIQGDAGASAKQRHANYESVEKRVSEILDLQRQMSPDRSHTPRGSGHRAAAASSSACNAGRGGRMGPQSRSPLQLLARQVFLRVEIGDEEVSTLLPQRVRDLRLPALTILFQCLRLVT